MISKENAERYVWGERCEGFHLVKQEMLSVIEERMPPGTAERPHRHSKARQFFYVLQGQARLEVEGQSHTLSAGQALEIPPSARHHIVNTGPGDVAFLVVSQPPSHGDRSDV